MPTIEVAKTDTIETQRQKINSLSTEFDTLKGAVTSPSVMQTIKEDFTYYPGFVAAFSIPSMLFGYAENEVGDGAAAYNVSHGQFTAQVVTNGTGDTTIQELKGCYLSFIPDLNEATDHTFETRIKIESLYGPQHTKTDAYVGFDGDRVITATPGTTKSFVGFHISFPEGANTTDVPVLTALVYNTQSPTPSLIFSQVIPGMLGTIYSDTKFNKFAVKINRSYAAFYLNGVEVCRFANAMFATGLVYQPLVRYNTEVITPLIGISSATIDYISVQSNLVG